MQSHTKRTHLHQSTHGQQDIRGISRNNKTLHIYTNTPTESQNVWWFRVSRTWTQKSYAIDVSAYECLPIVWTFHTFTKHICSANNKVSVRLVLRNSKGGIHSNDRRQLLWNFQSLRKLKSNQCNVMKDLVKNQIILTLSILQKNSSLKSLFRLKLWKSLKLLAQ